MNAIPELKPIEIAVVQRPKFQNACLGIPRLWIQDNTLALARYYKELTDALPADERKQSNAEIDCWLLVQHDLELRRQARARKVAEAIASIGNPNQPRTMYQPPRLSEEQALELHRLNQARKLK